MVCPKCNNTTFISKEIDGEMIAFPCDCRKEKESRINLDIKLIGASIPRKFWEYTFEQYIHFSRRLNPDIQKSNSINIEKLKVFIDNPGCVFERNTQVIWLWGPDDNSCHTTLAIILGTSFIKEGFQVKFITMQDLLNAFTDFNEKNNFFKEFDTYKVYIIDDMFDSTRCIAKGEYTRINLYNWINNSISNGKIFICTSNKELEKVDKDYLQSKIVLLRNSEVLEIQGSFTSALSKGEMK